MSSRSIPPLLGSGLAPTMAPQGGTMATRRRLRRLVIAPAAVCVVAGSLAVVGPTSGATAAASGTTGTQTSIHLRGQTTTYPKAGVVGHGQAANLTEDGMTRFG